MAESSRQQTPGTASPVQRSEKARKKQQRRRAQDDRMRAWHEQERRVQAAEEKRERQEWQHPGKNQKQGNVVFAVLFLVTILVIAPFLVRTVVQNNRAKRTAEEQAAQDATRTTAVSTTQPEETTKRALTEEEKAVFFNDTLFIGDSRTVGLSQYGGITGARFFCDVGMATSGVLSAKISVNGVGETTLEDLLHKETYKKIYINIGINEVGNPRGETIANFEKLLDRIQAIAPDTVIYLEGNIHVTAAKAAADPTFSKVSMDALNNAIKELADGERIFYIDPNEVFDDASGNLDPELTFDGVHPLGKYYPRWTEWLYTQ